MTSLHHIAIAAERCVIHVRCCVCKRWLRNVPCAPEQAGAWSDGLCADPKCKAYITGRIE